MKGRVYRWRLVAVEQVGVTQVGLVRKHMGPQQRSRQTWVVRSLILGEERTEEVGEQPQWGQVGALKAQHPKGVLEHDPGNCPDRQGGFDGQRSDDKSGWWCERAHQMWQHGRCGRNHSRLLLMGESRHYSHPASKLPGPCHHLGLSAGPQVKQESGYRGIEHKEER